MAHLPGRCKALGAQHYRKEGGREGGKERERGREREKNIRSLMYISVGIVDSYEAWELRTSLGLSKNS